MIVSHPGKWFIATPTKTGTHSLEAIANRPDNADLMEVAGQSPGDNRRRMHRMAPDPTWGGYRGYLLVRNPWSRWVSVYEYLRAPKFYAQWGAKAVQGNTWGGSNDPDVLRSLGPPMSFERFLSWILHQRAEHYTTTSLHRRGFPSDSHAYRSPWIWLDSLTVSRRLLDANLNGVGPSGLLHLEHLEEELLRIVGQDVAGHDLHPDQLNRTTAPIHPHWTDYWTPKARAVAARLRIADEAHGLGYPRSPS